MKTERMTWKEIVHTFPEQWVRLEDVEWEPDNDSSVVSAVVTRVGEPSIQDFRDAMQSRSVERYTETGKTFYSGVATIQCDNLH